MSKEIKKYNKNGNKIYWKTITGSESWWEYNEKNSLTYYKYSPNEYEQWREYDEENRIIHYRDTDNDERWWKYDGDSAIRITKQEIEEINFRKQEKEFLSREPVMRFELMEL